MLTARRSNYDKQPYVEAGPAWACDAGWDAIAARLGRSGGRVMVVETFPGVHPEDITELGRRLQLELVVDSRRALLAPEVVDDLVLPDLADDPVFGRISELRMLDFFEPARLRELRDEVAGSAGRVLVHGPGALLVARGDIRVLAEMPRWETQLRQRAGTALNLGMADRAESPAQLYRRSFFVDWRVCDRHKREHWADFDLVLDTTKREAPVMIPMSAMETGLDRACRRPLRVVPFFDPAPWGGQWMKEVCDLDRSVANFGWCFDCVPEENSLLLGFGAHRFETPATNLVFQRPSELLGEAVRARFGAEFPIRFDFLDTMGGGNLSLQVHPLTAYIHEHFGVDYTQDESYYMLDAGPGSSVFLGLRPGADWDAMRTDLGRAQAGEIDFPAERYVNRFPARRHDHFLIPAGTIHCSGAESMVLEISATPYIFTFKLWDWGRPGLDGLPRPISLDHGLANIARDRDRDFATTQLINRFAPVAGGSGWREERTGLHAAEFIETRRHWFSAPVPHAAMETLNVLNLVQGEETLVESPDRAFEPFAVHYAETFIVPAAAGAYTVRPASPGDPMMATIKAFVRSEAR